MSENPSKVASGPRLVLVADEDRAVNDSEEDEEPEVEEVFIPPGGAFEVQEVQCKVEIDQVKQELDEEGPPEIVIPVIKTEPEASQAPVDWWDRINVEEEVEQKVIPKQEVKEEPNTTIQAPAGFKLDPKAIICPLPECQTRFRYSKDLKIHFKSHTTPAQFQCDHCDKRCRSKHSLHLHVAEDHLDLVVKKENCGDPDIKVEVNQDEHQEERKGEADGNVGNEDNVEREEVRAQKTQTRKMPARLAKARKEMRQKGAIGKGDMLCDKARACDKQGEAKKKRPPSKRVNASTSQAPFSSRKSKSSESNSRSGQPGTSHQLEKGPSLSNVKEFECSKCGNRFSRRDQLLRHLRSHIAARPHSCSICGKAFRLKWFLKQHQIVHLDVNVRPFTCNICQKSYRTKSCLKVHERIHTSHFPFKCSYSECSKSFRRNSELTRHFKFHTKEKRHTCKDCGKGFILLQHLKVHTRIHTLYKPYKCNLCSKTFGELSYLKSHLKTHSDLRLYKCKFCGKAFKRNSEMHVHERLVHEKVRNFECNLCNKRLATSSALARHLRAHANAKTYSCITCDLQFKYKAHFDKHLKSKKHISKLK